MIISLIADYKENGVDKFEVAVVAGTNNPYLAAKYFAEQLTDKGYELDCVVWVHGEIPLKDLDKMAMYGPEVIGLTHEDYSVVIMSGKLLDYFSSIKGDKDVYKLYQGELRERLEKGRRLFNER